MKTSIVLLYGLYSENRSDYKGYLDFIATEIKQEKYEKVILCGGFTDPTRPNDSEASTAKSYLENKINFNNFILEDKSITTNQNLEFAKTSINEKDQIIVYGDLIRKAKIAWIAGHFLLGINKDDLYESLISYIYQRDIYKDLKLKNLIIRCYDFERNKEETIASTFNSILDVLSIYDKELNQIEINKRKELFGLK